MTDPSDPNISFPHFALSNADRDTLDAMMDVGFDSPSPPPADLRARRLHAVFSLLATPTPSRSPADDSALVDLTLARVLRAQREDAQDLTLSTADQDAFDAYMTEGRRIDRVPSPLRDRAQQADALGTLITHPLPSQPSQTQANALIERALARIPVRVRREDRSFRAGLGNFRFADMVSVAALLIIGVSVAMPLLATARSHQSRASCGSNFASLASAFSLYSSDYRDQLPVVTTAGFGSPASWFQVGAGPGKSNSANLFRLPKLQYTNLDSLACPGNGAALDGPCRPSAEDWSCISEVSYSYQNMFGKNRPNWRGKDSFRIAILADASPVIRRSLAGVPWSARQNSANHDGKGQWVLFNDASAAWFSAPIVGGDNIWLNAPQQLALEARDALARQGFTVHSIQLQGSFPDSDRDSFLGP